MLPDLLWIILGAVILLVVLLSMCYVKSSPNIALVISGLSKKPRYLVGKGGFRVPFLEKINRLYLGQITVDIRTNDPIPTNDFINVRIDAVAKVQVDMRTSETFEAAIKNFLDCKPEYIAREVQDTFEGNLRESVGAVGLKNLNVDRDAFSKEVQSAATGDLSQLGLRVLSCNIQNIKDDNNLISDLGADNVWQIKKDAAITKAGAEKDIAIAQAQAKQESNTVEVESEKEIAKQNNELKIKKADLKKESDIKQAEADAAYEIQKQNQMATINEKTVDAQIAQTKREQVLSQERIKIKENELQAEVNKKAEADKYKTETDAAAELERQKKIAEADLITLQKKAEAERYEAEQKALAIKAKADADRYEAEQKAEAIKKMGEANAYKIQQEGLAEAEKIKAAGLAEAEALEKKAEAFEKFGQAAILDTIAKIIPEVSKNVAEPMKAIKNLNIYSSDGQGAGSVTSQMPTVVKNTLDVVESLGVPVNDIMQASTKSAKTDKNIDIKGNLPVDVRVEE